MIILDTNVVSEPMKPEADPAVTRWLDRQEPETLYLTAVNLAELLTGIEQLPSGRRRDDLFEALTALLDTLFGDRILPFDRASATAFARLNGTAQAAGRSLPMAGGQIAAIAVTRGFTVATRDTTPFEAAGIPVLNPWEPG